MSVTILYLLSTYFIIFIIYLLLLFSLSTYYYIHFIYLFLVSKSFKTGGTKGGRNTKFVDRKLKGDKKMEKRAERRK